MAFTTYPQASGPVFLQNSLDFCIGNVVRHHSLVDNVGQHSLRGHAIGVLLKNYFNNVNFITHW